MHWHAIKINQLNHSSKQKKVLCHPVYDTQNIWFRKNGESPVMTDNKTSYVHHNWTSFMNNRTLFRKEFILLAFQRQNYYHRINYIISKSFSSKYNEVSHYHISYKGTSSVLKYFPRSAEWQRLVLYKHTGSIQKVNWAAWFWLRAVFKVKDRFKAERLLTSAVLPSGG